MVYFLSAVAGAFFISALMIGGVFRDECDGVALLLEGGTIICGVVFLSLARSIGG